MQHNRNGATEKKRNKSFERLSKDEQFNQYKHTQQNKIKLAHTNILRRTNFFLQTS